MVVCLCYAVTESDLKREVDAGATTADDITAATGAGAGCGSCQEAVYEFLERNAVSPSASATADCPTKRFEILSPYVVKSGD